MTDQTGKLTGDEQQSLEKAEILLLDADEAGRQFLVTQLERAGLIVTASPDPARSLQLARDKHFAVILVDLDTPHKGAGLEQLAQLQLASPASAVMQICGEATFEAAADGFRRGAADVAVKDQLEYLTRRVVELCLESRRQARRDRLLMDTLEVHDQFLKRLVDAYRRAEAAAEEASGQSVVTGPSVMLVVDDNPRTMPGLQQALGGGFSCVSALNGGEALDYATNHPFDLALVKESLPDLSGTMVARTLRSQNNDSIVVMFEHPGGKPGFASIVELSQTIELIPELTTAAQLVDRLQSLHRAYAVKKREKRYVQSFRQTNADFLKQYIDVRQRIQKLLPGGGSAGPSGANR